jgi:hypothetical protein
MVRVVMERGVHASMTSIPSGPQQWTSLPREREH